MIAVLAPLASLSQPLPTDPSPIDTPAVDWWAAAPMLVLVVGALVLMLVSCFVPPRRGTVSHSRRKIGPSISSEG